ncbi:MAG: glycosyltransferase, partial [Planctomycetota bacterium]
RRPMTVVCVTDYEVHANWIANADLYLAGSDSVYRKLTAEGKRVARLPMLPCRAPKFVTPKSVAREGDVLKILMVMGLEGSSRRKAKRIINQLLRSSGDVKVKVDVICGRNAKLKAELTRIYQNEDAICVHGFVDDIPERMQIANLALIRLSPNTMTEALAAGTPVIGFDWHVHEAECLTVLRHFGAGTGSLSVAEAIRRTERFLSDPELRDHWYRRAYKASTQAFGSELAAQCILDPANGFHHAS